MNFVVESVSSSSKMIVWEICIIKRCMSQVRVMGEFGWKGVNNNERRLLDMCGVTNMCKNTSMRGIERVRI